MENHETILKMIEEVRPDNADKLEEIEARFFCFRHGVKFYPSKLCWSGHDGARQMEYNLYNHPRHSETIPQVGRSRDALKLSRPPYWRISAKGIRFDPATKGYICDMVNFDNPDTKKHASVEGFIHIEKPCPRTEELAELHSIVRAWAIEKGE